VHGEGGPRCGRQHSRPQQRPHVGIVQRDIERVVYGGAVALDADVGGDRLRNAEQDQRLIEQVGAQVEPESGAGVRLFPPRARPELGTEAVEAGFADRRPAEHAVRQEFSQCYEVSHVAAVLVGRYHTSFRGPELHELFGLRNGCRKRLIDDDVASGQEALLGDRMMRRVRGGDDDQVDGPGEQLIDAADEFDVCIARVCRAAALDDGGEVEAVDRANDGGVKYLAREAETDESDVEHTGDCTRTVELRTVNTPRTRRPDSSTATAPPAPLRRPPDVRSHAHAWRHDGWGSCRSTGWRRTVGTCADGPTARRSSRSRRTRGAGRAARSLSRSDER